jgi:hypothetical protein|tara:strand:- start:2982 stop:3578 length:597 start_codon:yes stop_codon:yes gene_type:complete
MAISNNAIDFLQQSLDTGRPIPGQSLTNSPEEPYNWEKPAEFSNPKEAMLYTFGLLTEPETTANILINVTKGVSIIDIASIVLYQGFLEGKWNPDLMILLMEPTMYMVMALCEKAEIPYKLDSADDEDVEEIMGDKAVEKIEQEIGALDQVRRKAVQQVSPQSVPADVKEVIEQTEIQPSLLEKVEEVKSNSLLSKGE